RGRGGAPSPPPLRARPGRPGAAPGPGRARRRTRRPPGASRAARRSPWTPLAARAPVRVAAGELAPAYPCPAHQARLAGAAVDVHLPAVAVDPGRAAHRLGCVLRAYGVDPAGGEPVLHERPEVVPQLLPRGGGELPTGQGRRQPGPEQHLGDVDE